MRAHKRALGIRPTGRPAADQSKIAAPAEGHAFNERLVCIGCGSDWYDHRDAPSVCPTPFVRRCFADKGAKA